MKHDVTMCRLRYLLGTSARLPLPDHDSAEKCRRHCVHGRSTHLGRSRSGYCRCSHVDMARLGLCIYHPRRLSYLREHAKDSHNKPRVHDDMAVGTTEYLACPAIDRVGWTLPRTSSETRNHGHEIQSPKFCSHAQTVRLRTDHDCHFLKVAQRWHSYRSCVRNF